MNIYLKYSKPQNITNVDDITPKEYLLSLETENKTKQPDDYIQPYSYHDWLRRNTGITVNREQEQYNDYLNQWMATRYTPTEMVDDIKADYISFLKNLTHRLAKEDTSDILHDIQWDNQIELAQVIPYCAKRLKEIIIYLVNKRNSIKNIKLKYNMTGATQALERLFTEYLLKAFTQRNYVLNVTPEDIYEKFPQLSAVNDGFRIQIEELYDDTSYFDKSPALSASEYYTFSPESTAFYESMGFPLSSYEWLFKTGFASLCADNPLLYAIDQALSGELPLSAYSDVDRRILNDYYHFKFSKKYLGESQYYVSGGYYLPWSLNIQYDLQPGNNWFYWPSGELASEVLDIELDDIALTATNIISSGATGYKNYTNSDKIFVQNGNIISAAWLKQTVQETLQQTMSARMESMETNRFLFPYPGFGLSGEDLDWSGRQLSNVDRTYYTLSDDEQRAIQDSYWDTTTGLSSIRPISINNTKLVESGAKSGQYFKDGDVLAVRRATNADKVHDSNPDAVYKDEFQYAWLHYPTKTDIPIRRGQNWIQWPLMRYETGSTLGLYPENQCAPVALSAETPNELIGARAGHDLFDSDIIYKLNSRYGEPIEAAFLKGTTINGQGGTTFTANATGIQQQALTLKCTPNNYITFIWMDYDTDINNVIFYKEHQSDCPYRFEDHISLYRENPADNKDLDYRQWQKCTCGAIKFSPLGHPGSAYDDYRGYTDIIFKDDYFPLPFNKTDWKSYDPETETWEDYQNSTNFGWYQLTGTGLEPDIGWGPGTWRAGGTPRPNTPFILRRGEQYKYMRCPIGHSDAHLADNSVPYLIVKHKYTPRSNRQTIWTKAVADQHGNWVATNQPSDMVLHNNDFLVYDHIDSNWYCVTSIGTLGSTTTTDPSAKKLSNSVWQNYDYITIGTPVEFRWPSIYYPGIGPAILAPAIDNVYWGVTPPNKPQTIHPYKADETFTIIADTIGTWKVSLTGIGASDNVKYPYANIGNFSVVAPLETVSVTGARSIETIYTDTINMSWNKSIYGWDIDNNRYDSRSYGGRPFWAHAEDIKSPTTKQKGINTWGGGIRFEDDYVPITQPEFSTMVLSSGDVIEYTAREPFVWVQTIDFDYNLIDKQWCELLLDTTKVANISSILYNLDKELIVSANDNPSQIVLTQDTQGYPMFINYWAENGFTWSQDFYSEKIGSPPDGGTYVEVTTGTILEPVFPEANLLNRHYPTIATVPHVENLYSIRDVGGYFIPRLLGVSTFIAKKIENMLVPQTMPVSSNRGLSGVFRDFEIYGQDAGLSKETRFNLVSTTGSDASWMKGGMTEHGNAGMIINPSYYQQFMPYKTQFEVHKINTIGINRQGDPHDPWHGPMDDTWFDPKIWPIDPLTKQQPVNRWYTDHIQIKDVFQWKADVFDNQYALVKNLDGISMEYDKRRHEGIMYLRDNYNHIQPLSSVMGVLYTDYADYYSYGDHLKSELSRIWNFDIVFDVLMLRTKNFIVFVKIRFDYKTSTITSTVDDIFVYKLQDWPIVERFGGYWKFEKESYITLATIVSSATGIKPTLKRFYADRLLLTDYYNATSSNTNALSSLSMTAIDDPLLSYNDDTSTFVINFLGRSSTYSPFIVNSIFIRANGENPYVSSVISVCPLTGK